MKTINVWLVLVSLLVSFSCQTSSDLDLAAVSNLEDKSSPSEASAYERKGNEIQKIALDVATMLRSSDGLRSSKTLSVASVFTLQDDGELRNSSASNANLQVVEFSDNEGYAIVSENTGGAEVLYIADNGKFDKTFYSENLAPYVYGYINVGQPRPCSICGYIGECIHVARPQDVCPFKCPSIKECKHQPQPQPQPVKPGVFDQIITNPNQSGEISGACLRLRGKGNLLTTNWNLWEPFNLLTPKVKFKQDTVMREDHAAIGCNAVAIMQIMAYYKFPQILDGKIIPWERFRKMDEDDFKGADRLLIAETSKYVADEIKSTYGIDNSQHTAAYQSDVKRFMQKVGYKNYTDQPYNIEAVMDELDQDRPMFITASKVSGGGHIWILDGYKVMEYWWKDDNQGLKEGVYHFVHCNWGWGKEANKGYGLSKLFYIANLELENVERGKPDFHKNDKTKYKENCRIYTGIEPETH